MKTTNGLDETFDTFLKEPWPASVVSERQRLWLAFKCGAEWALGQARTIADLPDNGSSGPGESV